MTHDRLEDALEDTQAAILVHGPVKCDTSGNSRARQSVYSADGGLLFTDPSNRKSYWYSTQNERQAFERRGGLILSP
ncbi:MAG: hypothetical protein V3S55_07685 [Nitrospiraceae bacterium]